MKVIDLVAALKYVPVESFIPVVEFALEFNEVQVQHHLNVIIYSNLNPV